MYINLEPTFDYRGIIQPTYGRYGGDDYSAGTIGGETPMSDKGKPYLSYQALLKDGDGANDPVDKLDYLFYRHDLGIELAQGDETLEAQADADLLKALVKLNPDKIDPTGEASLYAGFATLGMLIELAEADQLSSLSPKLIERALSDALEDIQFGLENIPEDELLDILLVVAPSGELDFSFTVSTSTPTEAALESVLVNALNAFVDPGEALIDTTGDPSDYSLYVNFITRDIDFDLIV